jgi:hypothetical protein
MSHLPVPSPATSVAVTEEAEAVLAAAEAFFQVKHTETTKRGQKTLENIRAVCLEMISAKEEIIVAKVGRTLKERHGGPDVQSIRDQPERLKRLVEMYAAYQQALVSKRERPERRTEQRLTEINDLGLRAELREVIAERDELKAQVKALRQAFKRLQPIERLTSDQCYGPVAEGTSIAQVGEVSATPLFTPDEVHAVTHFLSEDFLYQEGLRIDDGIGLMQEESNRFLIEFPFITALRKIAGA